MPNIKSAKKRVLVTRSKTIRNQSAKSALKTTLKKFQAALTSNDKALCEACYKAAVKAVDKACAGGLLHKNNAARKISSLTLAYNAVK